MAQHPTIGRIVQYRSRTGNYSVPAVITATMHTLHWPNVDAGYIQGLYAESDVHLTVFTPGTPGRGPAQPDFVDGSDKPVMPNVGGLYQEYEVEFWEPGAMVWKDEDQPAGTWTWPRRVT